MNELYDIDDLIAKVLADEATADEQTAVESWLDAAPENRKYFDDIKRIWFESFDAVESLAVDTDAAWQRVHQRIHKPPKQLIVKLPIVGWPPKVAVITAVPTVKGVTTPVSLTVATYC